MNSYPKDPDAVLDWRWDWTQWLLSGEQLQEAVVTISTPPVGLTKAETETATNEGLVTVWLAGGTPGDRYIVTCRITTNQGRTDDRSILIRVTER